MYRRPNHDAERRTRARHSAELIAEGTHVAFGVMTVHIDWVEQQPEPTSDCDEDSHYQALVALGICPSCGQEAT